DKYVTVKKEPRGSGKYPVVRQSSVAELPEVEELAENPELAVKQTPNATDEEKQAEVNQINQLKDQAFNQINQKQTNDQVDATTNQAINAIDNVEAEVVIKPKAIADIEKAVKEKQKQIDNSIDSTAN
ncbi:DUF1542 domain-containing protein, partial [Staphylococcus aureus]|uniref:DUF1542 domain-containing protein n=1 Tax=Staphylococcus aureus TaxID=1280 RepID=UPI00210C8420